MRHLGERISALVDGELSHGERERALAHLTFCADCRAEVESVRALKNRLRSIEGPSTPADRPLIAVQRFTDERGITVNVPEDWTKSTGGSYVDFTDQAGSRKVRINVENAGSTARRFLLTAESGLKNNPSRCRTPYERLGLREAELAGRDNAAELEYTCGADEKRHGVWRAVVVDGKVAVREMLPITATIDHRYADGWHISKLMAAFREYLAAPERFEPALFTPQRAA